LLSAQVKKREKAIFWKSSVEEEGGCGDSRHPNRRRMCDKNTNRIIEIRANRSFFKFY